MDRTRKIKMNVVNMDGDPERESLALSTYMRDGNGECAGILIMHMSEAAVSSP